MKRERRDAGLSSDASTNADRVAPGKRALTARFAVQKKADPARPEPESVGASKTGDRQPSGTRTNGDDPFAVHLLAGGDAAGYALSSPASELPHRDAIQRSFGAHNVSGTRAHTGPAATAGLAALGAEGLASGTSVAFAGAPSLHTAAHEAAHVVQQRGGISLKGGIGQDGDAHEQHADQVADRVVKGESAEELLDQRVDPVQPSTHLAAGLQLRKVKSDDLYEQYRAGDLPSVTDSRGVLDKEDRANIAALRAGQALPFPEGGDLDDGDLASAAANSNDELNGSGQDDQHGADHAGADDGPDLDAHTGILSKKKSLYDEKKKKVLVELQTGTVVKILGSSTGTFERSWIRVQYGSHVGFINAKLKSVSVVDEAHRGRGAAGFVQKAGCRVRLHDDGLIVIAEKHTKVTLLDLVAATGTNRYMYEGFTGGLEGDEYGAVNAAVEGRKAALKHEHGVAPSGGGGGGGGGGGSEVRSNDGEDFHAKTMSAILNFDISPAYGYVIAGQPACEALRWAILFVAAQPAGSALHALYTTHQAVLDAVVVELAAKSAKEIEKSKLIKADANRVILRGFIDAYVAHGRVTVPQEASAGMHDDDQTWFDTQHQLGGNTMGADHGLAEKSREMSMFKRILVAKQRGDLLYSAGALHIERLAPLLAQHSIPCMTMDEYIAQQKSSPDDAKE